MTAFFELFFVLLIVLVAVAWWLIVELCTWRGAFLALLGLILTGVV